MLFRSLEGSVLATLYAREIGIPRIIVKCNSLDHGKVLSQVGATQVVYPEVDQAVRLARTLVRPNILDYIPLTEGYSISEVKTPGGFAGKTLQELNLTKRYGVTVIALRHLVTEGQKTEMKINASLSAETTIEPQDVMIVIGRDLQIAKLQALK